MFLKDFKKLLTTFRRGWDENKYRAGVDASDDDSAAEFNPRMLTNSLANPLFHQYVDFALRVESLTNRLASWAEGCPCHGEMFCGMPIGLRSRLFESHYGSGWSTCPAAGMRAPEMAAGRHFDVIEQYLP